MINATIIRIEIRDSVHGRFYATSPDMRGLITSEKMLDDLLDQTQVAIRDLLAAEGFQVRVFPAHKPGEWAFVAVPVEMLKEAKDEQTQAA